MRSRANASCCEQTAAAAEQLPPLTADLTDPDRLMRCIFAAVSMAQTGHRDEAMRAFDAIGSELRARDLPLHLCVLSHHMADLQDDPAEELVWTFALSMRADVLATPTSVVSMKVSQSHNSFPRFISIAPTHTCGWGIALLAPFTCKPA